MNSEIQINQHPFEISEAPDIRVPTSQFQSAMYNIRRQVSMTMILHFCILVVLIIAAFTLCSWGLLALWIFLYAFKEVLNLCYQGFQYWLLVRHKRQYAEGLNQLTEPKEERSAENEDELAAALAEINEAAQIDSLETELRAQVMQRNRMLQLTYTLTYVVDQITVFIFVWVLYNQQYKFLLEPLPHFSGNCEDITLNICLLFFTFQLCLYCFYYVTLLTIISFLPVVAIVGLIYGIVWCGRRIRFLRKVKRFTVKQGNQMPEEERECSICMQIYASNDNVKFIGCPANHHFHQKCIDEWMLIKGICPLCRFEFTQ